MVIVAMVEAIVCGDRFEITGYGPSTVREYEGYVGRNPKTGETTTVTPKNLPFFKVRKELAEGVIRGRVRASSIKNARHATDGEVYRPVNIEYTNRKEKRYFLHVGKTKKGTPRYYFSPRRSGELADGIPDGYEIYEHPNGQVYLRKIEPHLITDEEIQVVERELRKRGNPGDYKIDVREDMITVFESNQMGEPLIDLAPFFALAAARDLMEKCRTYTAILRFVIVDIADRLFVTERFCFRGRIDDWIHIGGPDPLGTQAKRFVSHLGKESFYEL